MHELLAGQSHTRRGVGHFGRLLCLCRVDRRGFEETKMHPANQGKSHGFDEALFVRAAGLEFLDQRVPVFAEAGFVFGR